MPAATDGVIEIGNQVISAGLPLAGQRVTLRLDGQVAHSQDHARRR